MPLEATVSSTVNAVYDKWAFSFRTEGLGLARPGQAAPGPIDRISAHATLVKYRVRPDGVNEMSPLAGDQVTIDVPDLYALAAENATVGAAVTALVEAVREIATMQGKL